MANNKFLFFFLFLSFPLFLFAQEKFTLSGYIKDAETGEELIGATVAVKGTTTGVSTNFYGFYSLTLEEGSYTITVQYVGFENQEFELELDKDQTLDIELSEDVTALQEVEITGERMDDNIRQVEMSTTKLQMQTIKQIPAIFGEVDLIKSIQLLPGITNAGEGTGGFFVRGGSDDQNLILLDEAPVYNASHLLGFFSVFNSDAIKDVQIYKGGIPAEHGGRLSSLLDIRMKEGNSKRFAFSGGIGTISSRLTLEAPIVKDKASFIVSGRRTYADIFLKLAPDTALKNNKLYFYDLNAKVNWRVNDKNRIFASSYFGRDVFKFSDQFQLNWGNTTSTFRWNHLFSQKLFSNFTFIYSDFDYSLGVPQGVFAFEWVSFIRDFNLKADFTAFLGPDNTLKWGISGIYHRFQPGNVVPLDDQSIYNAFKIQDKFSIEPAAYISHEITFFDNLTIRYGLRYSAFENIGPGRVYEYSGDFEEVIDTIEYGKLDHIQFYHGLEPRLAVNYVVREKNSIKFSYMRTRQYLHLLNNSTTSSPLDVWLPADRYIKPQLADQVAVGYFRNFWDNQLETSIELYYKSMRQLVDYRDNAQLLLNDRVESEILEGKGWSYGAEFLIRKQSGRFTGWVSYTLSFTRQQVPGINNGDPYPAVYDKTHDVSVVLNYQAHERVMIGANWVYSTGLAATFPAGRYVFDGYTIPFYTGRNDFRMPDYHRFDFSVTYTPKKKEGRRYNDSWNLSVYNMYMRKNAFSIYFREKEDNPDETEAVKVYLFSIIPSITYNFNF